MIVASASGILSLWMNSSPVNMIVMPSAQMSGLIVRFGESCYDLGQPPNDRGQFPVVPCP